MKKKTKKKDSIMCAHSVKNPGVVFFERKLLLLSISISYNYDCKFSFVSCSFFCYSFNVDMIYQFFLHLIKDLTCFLINYLIQFSIVFDDHLACVIYFQRKSIICVSWMRKICLSKVKWSLFRVKELTH
jgi:hypothetical protein